MEMSRGCRPRTFLLGDIFSKPIQKFQCEIWGKTLFSVKLKMLRFFKRFDFFQQL